MLTSETRSCIELQFFISEGLFVFQHTDRIFINRTDSSNTVFKILPSPYSLIHVTYCLTKKIINYYYYYHKNADHNIYFNHLQFVPPFCSWGISFYVAGMHTVYVILTKSFQCKWISVNKNWHMRNHLGNPNFNGISRCSIFLQCTLHMDDSIPTVHMIHDEKCKCVRNMHMVQWDEYSLRSRLQLLPRPQKTIHQPPWRPYSGKMLLTVLCWGFKTDLYMNPKQLKFIIKLRASTWD